MTGLCRTEKKETNSPEVLLHQKIERMIHDVRSPLSIVRGYLFMLAHGQMGPLSLRQNAAVVTAGSAVEQIISLTEAMSSLSEKISEALGDIDQA